MKKSRKLFVGLAVLIIFVQIFCSVSATLEIPFTDVPQNEWYYADVCNAYNMTLINGRSNTIFAPNEFLTCAEAIKLAACMYQVYTNDAAFVVSQTPWYKVYVDYCYEKGIIDREYNWQQNITRGEYMDIFSRALPQEALQAMNTVDNGMIPDVPMSYRYAQSIYKLYRAGVVQGQDSFGNCAPDSLVKRCEVAAILTRMMDKTKRVSIKLEDPALKQNQGTTGGGASYPGIGSGTGSGSGSSSTVTSPSTPEAEPDENDTLPWQKGGKKPSEYTWDEFQALGEKEQEAFYEWFGSSAAFESWMNSVKDEEPKEPEEENAPSYPWEKGGKKPNQYTWDEFQALDEIEQEAFYEWFSSSAAFESWMNSVKDEEPEENTPSYPWEKGGKKPNQYTWEEFQALDPYAQEAFFEWFSTAEEFEAWMNNAN